MFFCIIERVRRDSGGCPISEFGQIRPSSAGFGRADGFGRIGADRFGRIDLNS